MKRGILLPIVCFLAGGAIVAVFKMSASKGEGQSLAGPGPSQARPQGPSGESSHLSLAVSGEGRMVESPSATEAIKAGQRTTRDILSEYWGGKWPEISSKASEAGINLDALVTPPPPWKEVAPRVENIMTLSDAEYESLRQYYLWPNETTNEYLVGKYESVIAKTDQIDTGRVESIASEYQGALSRGLEEYRDLVNEALRDLWEREGFRRGPLFLPQEDGKRRIVMTTAHVVMGWSITYSLYADDYPLVADAHKNLERLRREREDKITSYLGHP